jgi:hypothetical protein
MMSASPTRDARDTRAVGALLALGLDAALLMGAAALVLASITPALGLVFAAAGGLAVAPLFGWRYGPCAGHLPDRSRTGVLRTLALIDALVVAVWVAFGFTVPVDGGVAGRLTFVAYMVVIYTLVVVVLTFAVALPISLAWTRLMERVARR